MIGSFFHSMGWTRDDLKWTVGTIAAVVVGLATLGNTITDYGIPMTWLPYIRLVALIVGLVSARMATSSLPGKMSAIMIAVGLSALMVSGCAAKGPRAKTRTAALTLGHLVLDVDAAERQLYESGAYVTLCGNVTCAKAIHDRANPLVLSSLKAARAFERAAKAWPASVPFTPDDVAQAKRDLLSALAGLEDVFPPGTVHHAIKATTDAVRNLIGG